MCLSPQQELPVEVSGVMPKDGNYASIIRSAAFGRMWLMVCLLCQESLVPKQWCWNEFLPNTPFVKAWSIFLLQWDYICKSYFKGYF